ncbi:LPXTG cell wall anchor domain-containing protein [Listeria riparia]|uniref:Cell wall anchor domain-containing protein n=1 Tax=Listeria riparia FSL S10-1204 TaxID=1265816 RepID=W7D916_9LIST|nr:LPXTG cell wall anchor domain-containing protein [Listeria riparia]EUJ45530.1 cell wall anchor domain-containing protein [Listeria riparia FSL S10-1204]
MANKTTKLACGLLACGLTLSLTTPVFAEETQTPTTLDGATTQETNTDATPATTTTSSVTPKTDTTFTRNATVIPADFVTITDTTNGPALAFKSGAEATTTAAGTFTTTIIATFADATTQEITVNYTVTEPIAKPTVATDAALGTAKTGVTTEINVAVKDPSKFVTAASGVTLSFAKAPVVNRLGAQTATVIATNGTTTENITATYTVVDTTKPVITADENDFYIGIDEEWTADELVTATDNSGFVKVYFENGKKFLDTATEGSHTTVVVAEDASGNTSSVTLSYEVIGDDVYFFDAPVVDVNKTTATDVYGKAEPNTAVFIISEDGQTLLSMTDADANGNFHSKLETPLVKGQTIYLISMDEETGEMSDVAEFTFQGGKLQVAPVENTKKPAVVNTVQKVDSAPATKTPTPPTTIKELPQTGDNSATGIVFAGLTISALAAFYLRKRS